MRYKVWIAPIACGTLLVCVPPFADYLAYQRISQVLLERKDFTSFNFGVAPMSSQYRLGCWALGAAMIFVGTLAHWKDPHQGPDDLC